MSETASAHIEQMRQDWAAAKNYRALALNRRKQVFKAIEDEFARTGRQSLGDLELIQLKRTQDDWEYRMHMGDNGWFTNQAMVSALMAIAELLNDE